MLRFFSIAFAIIAVVFLFNYEALSLQKKHDAQENARVISTTITENLDQLEKALIFAGKRVAKESPDLNLEKIYTILSQTASTQIKRNLLSWTSLGWVNPRGYQLVNVAMGVTTESPQYMVGRNYRESGNEPWKLILSEVSVGNVSGQLIIPAGIQVENDKHKRLGVVNCGVSIKEMVSLIGTKLTKYDRFIVVDERIGKAAFDYAGATEIVDGNFHDRQILTSNQNLYVYSVSMAPKYPYTILVGYDRNAFWLEMSVFAGKQILIIFSIFALLMLLRTTEKNR